MWAVGDENVGEHYDDLSDYDDLSGDKVAALRRRRILLGRGLRANECHVKGSVFFFYSNSSSWSWKSFLICGTHSAKWKSERGRSATTAVRVGFGQRH